MPLHSSSRTTRAIRSAIRAAVWTATVATTIGAATLALTNDANPFGMLLGFAPRWWAVLPWGVLLPLAFFAGRATVLGALAGSGMALLGVAQFELPTRVNAPSRGDIRVVTYNTDLSTSLADRLRNDVKKWDADVVLLQDCRTIVSDSLRNIMPYAATVGRFCMASKWPVLDARDAASLALDRDPRLAPFAHAARALVRTPFGVVPVYSVHLPSPRDALGAARWFQPRALLPKLRRSLAERGEASAAVSSIVRRSDDRFIVAGDFNLPYGSAILTRDWGDLTNAFAHTGTGFGYTMQAGVFPVRIDHLLTPRTLEPVRTTILRGYPSEHQPVVVDLMWR